MAALPGAAVGPVAERRVCSVLFCDVVGFTPLSEARDPEAVRELLSAYFAVARTVVGRYGGVVEKFIGDAVMAVWGTPVAAEGDAERAVRAALDLVAAVADLGAEAGVPGLAARAGVVTGEVAVTLGATQEGMVAGDAVNTAARVQAAAGPGSVLVDGATRRLAESAVGFADAGEHALKGKAEPQRLWRATRVVAGVGGSQRVDGLEARLTGRDAELRTVRELFHAAADRRVPRLVLVSGPAGVGKSRLGWEFRKYIDGLKEDVWWHRGRCLSYGDGVAFWALAEIVRQRMGIAEEDPAGAAAGKLAAGLAEFVPDLAERAYVGARVGRLLGVPVEGDGGGPLAREELFAGWRLFFERLAGESPVVVLVEDAQHADAGLLDFLDYLTDWVRDLPVYVLVLARPELGRARPGFGVGRNRSTLTLDPLDPASMDQLVEALVPGMPGPARAKITGQAQGIPLFAVETVRSLIDHDIVQPIEGSYRLVGEVGELAVPDSLHALLAARLDALDPGVRRLVADAAVLGATFPAEALIGVSGQDEAIVRAALDELVRREVLSVSADPLSPEKGSYGFAQHLLRQVAYDTLSRRDRKTRHLAVAAHLRAAFPGDGEEVAEVIARHYLDALDAVPDAPDAETIRGHAIAALVRAAERAERTGAPGLAATSYASAAQLTQAGAPDGEQAAAALWERAALAASTNADFAAAVEQAGLAGELYRQGGDARSAARAQAIAGEALRRWGRHAQAREQLTAAVGVLRDDPDTDTVQALGELATLEVLGGAPEADALTAEALALGQALAVDDATLAHLFTTRGICHGYAGRRPEAAAYLREAARLAAGIVAAGLLVGALISAAGIASVFAVCAGLGLAAALLVAWLRVPPLASAPERAPAVLAGLGESIQMTVRQPRLRLMLALLTAEAVVVGALDLLFVILAISVLHRPQAWAGYLNSAYGVGAVLAAVVTATLVGRRLGLPILGAALLLSGALAVLAAGLGVAATVALLIVVGASRALLDVATRTLLQRSVPAPSLGRIFGVLEGLTMAGLAAGALLVPALVAVGGSRLALLGVAAVLPLAAVAGGRALFGLDAGTPVPVVEIALLRSLPLFADLPAPALEGLAVALTPAALPVGTVLMRQGEPGDAYYAIAAGELDVQQDGHLLRQCGRGDGVGEIALLRAIPRTATVVAHTAATVYRLDREPFLTAVLGNAPTLRHADDIAAARLATTDASADGDTAR